MSLLWTSRLPATRTADNAGPCRPPRPHVALVQLPGDTDWVFRLDADEVVSDGLAAEIQAKLADLKAPVAGVSVSRRMTFLGRVPGSSEIPPGAGVPTLQHLK